MNEIYQVASSIDIVRPMSYYDWKQWHEWPYQQISNHIITKQETIVDVGAGCGFLGMYLLLSGKCDRIIAYDTRKEMRVFMKKFFSDMGYSDKIDIREQFYNSDGVMAVSTRLGFSNLLLNNNGPTITLARTYECMPLFDWVSTPDNWFEKVVERDDGFQLRVLWNYPE